MKKIVLSIAVVLIAMGVLFPEGILAQQQGTPPYIKVSLALTDSQESYLPDLIYLWDDPIPMVITLENKETENVITTKGFPKRPFHLLLIFTGPDGKIILTHDPGDITAGDAPPPKVIPVQDKLKQVERVESLDGGWVVRVDIPDAHAYYTLTKAGNYSVKAVISMRTYHRISYPGPPEDYSEIIGDDFKWSGALQSNTVYFAILPPPLDHIEINPEDATIIVGGNQSYTAEGFDVDNNSLGDVTSETIFTISPDGSCTENTCTATVAGPHTVTATHMSKTATATLQVNPAALNQITISPATATIVPGGSQAYTATGYDSYNNTWDVTLATTFSITPEGSCNGNTCTATSPGTHTVTGSHGGMSATATLTVVIYNFTGFDTPVANPPAVNKVIAVSTVPVKWRITDTNGVGISDPESFVNLTSSQVSCKNWKSPKDTRSESEGLVYLGDGNWKFEWKTLKNFADTCRIMTIKLNDGTEHEARFQFIK